MLWDEEVPHDIRKDFLILCLFSRMGCGKRRGEEVLLIFLFEDCTLPQADTWMGKYCSGCVRGFFIFLSLHHFAMHFCLAIPISYIQYIYFSVFAWQN
jgi:hypothetical protein